MDTKTTYRQADTLVDAMAVMRMAKDFHDESDLRDIPFDDSVFWGYLVNTLNDKDSFLCLAERNNELIGFISGSIYQLYFSKVMAANSDIWYVAPEYRGGLTGTRLLKRFENWAEFNGARFLVSGSSSGITVDRVHKLIERFGYEPIGSEYRRDLHG